MLIALLYAKSINFIEIGSTLQTSQWYGILFLIEIRVLLL